MYLLLRFCIFEFTQVSHFPMGERKTRLFEQCFPLIIALLEELMMMTMMMMMKFFLSFC